MKPAAYIPNAASEATWVINAFIDALSKRLPDSAAVREIRGHLERETAELFSKHQGMLVDEPGRHALRQGAAVLIAFRHLQGTLPDTDVLEVICSSFTEPLRDFIRSGTTAMLDHAEDPFTEIVRTSKVREKYAFGETFQFERSRDDNEAYHLNITRCLWHTFFEAEGVPELTAIFCEFDEAWIAAVIPVRHGLTFQRTTTLGLGGALCPFHFSRVTIPKT